MGHAGVGGMTGAAHTLSPELISYLADWLSWAENGAPSCKPYRRTWGLCSNSPYHVYSELEALLEAEFGKSASYPFGGPRAYNDHANAATQHQCAERIAWVKATLAKATGQ